MSCYGVVESNSISTGLELFYAKGFGECVHCTFIFTCFKFFVYG